jgi:hypothetical protein
MRLAIAALSIGATLGCAAPRAADYTDASATPDDAAAPLDTARPGGDAFVGCAEASYTAEQAPAAIMVVLDRSESMGMSNKYNFAAQAIVQALDQDVFDPVAVGLYAAPSGTVGGPQCLLGGLLSVACQVPPFPAVDLAVAGSDKSNAPSGVRRDIKQWLNSHAALGSVGDASPLYGALQTAIGALQAWPEDGNRILMVVTDGSISCNQFSSRTGFADCNGCDHDWEDPRNIVQLLDQARNDTSKPVQSFIMGVPGSDTYDSTGCEQAPYRMRAALSAIAYAGSDYTPAGCDGTTFTPPGTDPTVSCHFDMTQGNFSIQQVADTLSFVRGEVLGCVFDLPEPPMGQELDLGEINVEYEADGTTYVLGKRSNPSDTCDAEGCWDYVNNNTQIELIGKACVDVKAGASVEVKIISGCTTIVL